MCCEMPTRHGWHHAGSWCCCPQRRFLTKKEEIERLEKYAEALEKELAGLEEYIKELKKKP